MKRLRFLHIPKTGGSTLGAILRRQYWNKKRFRFTGNAISDRNRFEALPEHDKENTVLFYGHAPIVTGVKEADNATTITLLRDPINRVKSFCQHVAGGKSKYLINGFPPDAFNLDSFLESGNEELSNLQTKFLIDSSDPQSSLLIKNMSVHAAKDKALDNLFNKILHFGLQEYFDQSLIIFSSALNWRMPVYASKNKKNIRRSIQFERRHLEMITALNTIDLEVYR